MKSLLISLALLILTTGHVFAYETPQEAMGRGYLSRTVLEAPRKAAGGHLRVRRYPYSQKAHRRFSDGRPRAWCGWYMRQVKGVSNPSFNVARAWVKWGDPSGPMLGAVVVWPHHVGYISGYDKRGWLVTSGNWNNRIATVPLSRMPRNIIAYRM